MFKEFKAFAAKGNVLDLAVGVIIGSAFGKIVTSLVNDIIMPLISLLTGGINFNHLNIVLKEAEGDVSPVTLNYGQFIQNTLDFLIIAFSIFLFIKLLTRFKDHAVSEKTTKKDPEPSPEAKLLAEIRDLLKINTIK